MSEPEFNPDWYDLGIRSHDPGEDGGPIGNRAYVEWMERVLTAASGGRKVDWTHVQLGIVLDRMVQRDEKRRAACVCSGHEVAYCPKHPGGIG